MTAVAKKEEPAQARKVPEIDPARVQVNVDGQVFRSMFIRLPEGFIADDLKEVSAWRRVQLSPRVSLRKFDKVSLVAFDESWLAECLVVQADNKTAVLSKPQMTQFGDRFDKLFSTDEYAVEWMGAGYVGVRKSDGARMFQPVASAAVAERQLIHLYPRSLT